MSVPCSRKLGAQAPSVSNSINAFLSGSLKISRQVLAILHEAAVCELEGPRITGPMTSLKIPGSFFIYFLYEFFVRFIKNISVYHEVPNLIKKPDFLTKFTTQ
jgi:hypothetical protein